MRVLGVRGLGVRVLGFMVRVRVGVIFWNVGQWLLHRIRGVPGLNPNPNPKYTLPRVMPRGLNPNLNPTLNPCLELESEPNLNPYLTYTHALNPNLT